jgi:hypothetical protein
LISSPDKSVRGLELYTLSTEDDEDEADDDDDEDEANDDEDVPTYKRCSDLH